MNSSVLRFALLAVLLAGAAACHRDASKVKAKALWLCRHAQLPEPSPPQILPESWKLDDYVRAEDLDYQREKLSLPAEEAGIFGGLAVKMMEKAVPVGRALLEARSEKMFCEAGKVEVKGDNAKVQVKVAAPRSSAPEGLEVIAALSGLDGHEARLAKARTFFKEAPPESAEEVEIRFIRSGGVWRAEFGLPEEAARETKRKEQLDCIETASEAADQALGRGEFASAVDSVKKVETCRATYLKLGGLPTLVPEDLDGRLSRIKQFAAARKVPVKWVFTSDENEIDGTITASLRLEAEEETQLRYRSFRSTLWLRCKTGEPPEAFFSTGGPVQSIYGDWDRSLVRMRLDDGSPQTLRASESTSGEALFFPGATRIIEDLRGAKRLLLGWTPHGSGETVTEYDVHGLDEKLSLFQTACAQSGR